MIYGRRVIESHQWLHKTGSRRKLRVNDYGFQQKYTFYLIASVAGSTMIFLVPALYFLQQNYQIFTTLAYKTEPYLLVHLEREILWIKIFFGLSSVFLLALCGFIGYKLTESILGPLISIEKHMKKVSRGDWTQTEFKIRAHDDYRSLANTYSYLYKSIRAQAEQDLKWIEKIIVDPQNREAMAAWNALVKTKHSQLGINLIKSPSIESVEGSALSRDRRRAS